MVTRKELNLAIFEGTADKVLWQPRLETWIGHHTQYGTFPARYRSMDNLQIYDALRCSIRYEASVGIVSYQERGGAIFTEERHADRVIQRWRTSSGEISMVHRQIWKGDTLLNSRIEDFPVKTVQDLHVATDLMEYEQYRADVPAFEAAARRMGQRGEPSMIVAGSGFTDLIKNWAGLLNTNYLLYDHPAEVEAFLAACDRRDDRIADAALQIPCRIFNLGDHANNEFTPPPILKKYLIPRWQRLSERYHAAGRFVHTHWDGNSRLILPYLKEMGLDGVEALPPAPMGDMTLEEIKTAVGDKIVVLDLLRAIDFLPAFPLQELLDFTKRVMDIFAPRLILGISDEISQVGEIEKVEAITELVDKTCGLAE